MSASLFGNKTREAILRKMSVAEPVSPHETARGLGIPLNMVQRELSWLEKQRWLKSLFAGNKKYYYWDQKNTLVKPLRFLLKKMRFFERQKRKTAETDPSFGLHLPLRERVRLCEELTQEGIFLSPRPQPRPFLKVFDSIDEYARWKKKQTNPWLI